MKASIALDSGRLGLAAAPPSAAAGGTDLDNPAAGGRALHVCFLCNEYPPEAAGVGTFTATMGRALAARGLRVSVLGFYPVRRTELDSDNGVRVVRLPHARVPHTGLAVHGVRLNRALSTLDRELPIDVLEAPEGALALARRGFPASKVLRMHGGHHYLADALGRRPRRWKGWLERQSFARADAICAVSHFVAARTRALLGLGDRAVEVIPNPVDLSRFRPAPDSARRDGLILFVGTVYETKGIRQLVQAMPLILRAVPGAHLRVVGPDWSDPRTGRSYTEYLRGLLPDEARPHVTFEGAVSHERVPAIMAQASVCVYPSLIEALPVAWLETMAMGRAIVASRSGPGPEVVEDGVTGLLCDPRDPADIAERVIAVLTNTELRRRLEQAARANAVARYAADILAARNEHFYRRCVAERRSHA